jgi:predicted DCC family thiol-disulfide oxidoreductase YuxK
MSLAGPVVLYDGVCGLCQRSVRFLLRHERGERLRFAALSSETGRRLLRERGVPDGTDAMVLVEPEATHVGADAALALCGYLRWPYRWLRGFRILPAGLRRRLYGAVAARRRRWFGTTETCELPAPGQADRFLS